jgi:hypothetical protein
MVDQPTPAITLHHLFVAAAEQRVRGAHFPTAFDAT